MTVIQENESTEVGSYFVSNYPPFSAWNEADVPVFLRALDQPTAYSTSGTPTPLGLYLHIPFCRKRCKFCYFRVYTDKNSSDVATYLDCLARETKLYAQRAALTGRNLEFVYFGGGTPSFLSSEQLKRLVDRISADWQWDQAKEVSFECEPGTLRKGKLETIKAIGTTRLSLGVEHFDDDILSANGRAHKSPEVYRSYDWAREVGFDHINIDLIAGMIGDSEAKWKHTVDEALKMAPDGVTIYQMEVPRNTVFSKEGAGAGQRPAIASWPVKRAWVDYAFDQFEQAGYFCISAYTLVKDATITKFVYSDALWHGADMIGAGVASFGHISGVHGQNSSQWGDYVSRLQCDQLPLARALRIPDDQRLIREMILQLKTGHLDAGYFRAKFAVDIVDRFSDVFASLTTEKLATIDGDSIRLTRQGLLQADGLLPRFYEPQFRNHTTQ